MNLAPKCAEIQLLLSDVDGVLTDGMLTIDNQGVETKRFHVRDGQGVRLWQHSGGRFGIVTARNSQIVKLRAAELDVEIVHQGVQDKWQAIQGICEQLDVSPQAVCYVGDDLPDLMAIKQVGLGIAVADAAEDVRQVADYVTSVPGGRGAIREVVELLLKNSDRWETAISRYTGGTADVR